MRQRRPPRFSTPSLPSFHAHTHPLTDPFPRRGLSVVAAHDLVKRQPPFSLSPSAFISPDQAITVPHPCSLTPLLPHPLPHLLPQARSLRRSSARASRGRAPPPIPLVPKRGPRGLSVVAARDLVEGEPLFSLPPSAFISPEQPITLPHPYPLTPDASPLSGWTAFSILAAWILREKRKVESGEGSQWGVYVQSLPEYVPLPVFFPNDLIQEFEVQSMIDHAFSYRETFKSEYERCDKAAIGNASQEEFIAVRPPRRQHHGLAGGWAFESDAELFLLFPFFCFSLVLPSLFPTINTPFALPPHTLSTHSHSQTDEQTDTIVVRSYAALPAGSQLYNSYGTKSTDMFLQAYGFVPSDNPHDSFPLTSSEADLAEIYYKHYANVTVKEGRKGMFDLWAEYLLRRTTEDVRAAKEKAEEEVGVIAGPKADVFGEGSAHAVWAGGQVDPRMLLFLASLWHVFGYGEEPNYAGLAQASVWFGWHVYSGTCADMAQPIGLTDHELTSLLAGADLVRDEVRQALASWSTPIDEDRRHLKQLEKCWWVDGKIEKKDKVGEGEAGEEEEGRDELEGGEEVCTEEVVKTLMERELVLQYRIAKKKLLHDVYDRLEEGCSSLLQSESPETDSAEAASEGLKGLLPELTVPSPPLPAEQHDEL
ncbi:unnamed protein product [Closterium sp. Naga37s-1]|nr:unnamed protein product [Closterium sp. Naga37s-1]